jgi:hypothetical protein
MRHEVRRAAWDPRSGTAHPLAGAGVVVAALSLLAVRRWRRRTQGAAVQVRAAGEPSESSLFVPEPEPVESAWHDGLEPAGPRRDAAREAWETSREDGDDTLDFDASIASW